MPQTYSVGFVFEEHAGKYIQKILSTKKKLCTRWARSGLALLSIRNNLSPIAELKVPEQVWESHPISDSLLIMYKLVRALIQIPAQINIPRPRNQTLSGTNVGLFRAPGFFKMRICLMTVCSLKWDTPVVLVAPLISSLSLSEILLFQPFADSSLVHYQRNTSHMFVTIQINMVQSVSNSFRRKCSVIWRCCCNHVAFTVRFLPA